jgi:hypothetical protein
MRVLSFYSLQTCPGCRDGETQCTLENCFIRKCTLEKNINFCAECDEFPCNKVELPQVFINKWKSSGNRIKEIGLEQFFAEEKIAPHYLRYKKPT